MHELSNLRVALIHYWLVGMRGGEKVLEALCRLFPKADIYTHVVCPENLSATLRAHPIHTTFIQHLPRSAAWYQRYLPLMPLALEQLDLRGYDVVISSESGPAKGVITRADTPHICYCHSPMRYLWDFYPEYLASAGTLTRLMMRPLFHRLRQWDYASAQRVDHVVANSSTVARRVQRWWGRDAAVVCPPVDCQRFNNADTAALKTLPQPPAPGSYYLCLSELVSYKRIDVAVRACNATNRTLIVAGDGAERQRLEAMAGSSVRFVGRVDNDLLSALYAGAKGFLFPGEEDFGITPVEAMAAGCPVIAYGKGGVCDSVLPNSTGVFFYEQTPEALNAALDNFECRQSAGEFAPEHLRAHAAQFTEANFAAAMLAEITRTVHTVNPRLLKARCH